MSEQSTPSVFVSVIIPSRNEAAHIADCIRSVLATSWPADRLEVIVVDGASDDGTAQIVNGIAANEKSVRLLNNPQRIVPTALNVGIAAARGDVIVRMDAHSRYPTDYIPTLVLHLFQHEADNVGGVWITEPANQSSKARAIALALAHPLAVGNAHYRVGVKAPTWVDTVPFGCFRRDVFDRIGLFDEELVRNQDDEFNHRLLRAGGKILLVPSVQIRYFARESFSKLSLMMYQYGLFKPLAALKVGRVTTVRQLVPGSFVLALIAAAILAPFFRPAGVLLLVIVVPYALAALAAGLPVLKTYGSDVALHFVAAIPVIHLSYGLGYLRGALALVLRSRSALSGDTLRMSR